MLKRVHRDLLMPTSCCKFRIQRSSSVGTFVILTTAGRCRDVERYVVLESSLLTIDSSYSTQYLAHHAMNAEFTNLFAGLLFDFN